jgi:hypothetical protein
VGADNLVIETVSGQAWTHLRLGRLEDAQRCAAEVIAVGERTGEEYMTTFSLVVLGLIAGMRGNGDEQMRRYAEALRRSRAAGAPVGTALSLEAIAHAALDRGDVARGIRLAAAARRMRDESTTGATLDQLGIEGPLERARVLVDDTVYESAVEEGSALPAEDAAAAAIERY